MNRRPEQLGRYRVPTWLLLIVSAIGGVGVVAIGGDRAEAAPASVVVVLDDASPAPTLTTDRALERTTIIGGCLGAGGLALTAVAVAAVHDTRRRRRVYGPIRKGTADVEAAEA